MSKFKEGQYVIKRLEMSPIYRVCRYAGERTAIIEKSMQGVRITCEVHESMLRLATNNDFINTLTPKQKANWIMYRKNVCTPKFCKVGDCSNAGCEKAVINFLNQPYDGWRVEE